MNRLAIILVLLATVCASTSAQRYQRYQRYEPAKTLYMYAASYNLEDSTLYLSEVKSIDGAYVEKGTGFIYARNEYSGQFKEFLKVLESKDYTTFVSYGKSLKKVEKKYAKMRQKFQKDHFGIKYIAGNSFSFTPIAYSEAETEESESVKQTKKPERPSGRPDGPKGGMGGPGGGAPGGMGMPMGGGPGGMGGH